MSPSDELEQSSFSDVVEDRNDQQQGQEVTPKPTEELKPPVVAEPKKATEPESKTASTVAATSTPSSKRTSLGEPLPIKLGLADQTPLDQLSAVDVIMWRNYLVTLPVFLAIQALFLLIVKYEFSVVTLVGRIVLLQVILSIVYMVVFKIVQNNPNLKFPFEDVQISEALVNKIVSGVVANVNAVLKYYVDILSCKNLSKSLLFALVVQIICWLGKKISGETFLYVALNVLFTLPLIYEWKQTEIDNVVSIGCQKAKEQLSIVYEKLPPQAKEFLSKLDLEKKNK
ncbi:hypothetical protein C9374_012768 [Naegleria lovaniensis]|uniref:Reticulon-like protein n=1 Tax=Naegleria lovaniensis TaxID=51637 RepID=A0AA88GAZ2_NAELO|nr:uncharacterized protein C9374_012768 [Naegleria lovaniensis]KAG2373166.1 hypothetical protein C9374_012768 [Naegleria lovaniensis]